MNDSTIIDSAVFQAVFLPDSPEDKSWSTFLVKEDGLWVKSIDEHLLGLLSSVERLEVTRHPTGNSLHEPALKFPCTLGELKAFLAWEGYGDLDDADLADLEELTMGRHVTASRPSGEADIPDDDEPAPSKRAAIAKRHAELERTSKKATLETSRQFGVTDRYVRKCVEKEGQKSPCGMVHTAKQIEHTNSKKPRK